MLFPVSAVSPVVAGHPVLTIHLCFSIPSALLMPVLLLTGLLRLRTAHLVLAVVFAAQWIGKFVTGVLFV
jgi:hypothetical protein